MSRQGRHISVARHVATATVHFFCEGGGIAGRIADASTDRADRLSKRRVA